MGKGNNMNERINKLKEYIQQLNEAGVRSTLFYPLAYQSLRETKGEPVQMRRAKAQAHLLDCAPLAVHPYELIAGSLTEYFPLEQRQLSESEQDKTANQILEGYLEKAGKQQTVSRNKIKTFESEFTSKKSRWALMSRVYHDASITYEELQSLIARMEQRFAGRLEKYEVGRELERAFKIDYGKEVQDEINSLPWFAANHLSLNYASVMQKGFRALEKEIVEAKKQSCANRQEYYEAAHIVVSASVRFMRRYAKTLQEQATMQIDETRKAELLSMSKRCEKLASEKAETFKEGLQFVWMLHIMASLLWGSALSFGRFDQYMHELYETDLAEGRITQDEAKELLCCMWLKINEPRMRTVQSLTVGGITPDGKDAVNSLTKLCLDVVKQMQLPYPNVGVRVNRKNPEWLYDSIIESVQTGGGQPMIMADDVWIPNLKKLGYPDQYANDYYNMGCVEIMIPGKQPNWGVTDPIAFPMLFEGVFEKYRAGEFDLLDFAAFLAAYHQELKQAIEADKREADEKIKDMKDKCFDPFASLMIDGCLQNGADMFQGGSELGTHWSFYAYGLGTAADAMMAVKKHIYDEKRFSIQEMSEMLEKNFHGWEEQRRWIEKNTPHYGNDNEEVDALADDILSAFNNRVLQYNSPNDPNKFVSTLFGYFFHIYHGEITGATPNGRKKGEPFSDSMGPSQGKDVGGPSCLLNSVLNLRHDAVTGGYALNLKINPDLVRSEQGHAALRALLKAYVEDCGPQVQINFVDVESLRAAKTNPEQYKNLIVRIGGYCEYFVNLDSALQDEIITRTMHGV